MRGGRGQRVEIGGRGIGDDHAVFLPLVAQRCSPCCHHRERRCLSGSHRLTPWVRGDRGRHGGRVHLKRRRRTRHRPHRVADHHRESRSTVRSRSRWRGVVGGGRTRDRHAVLPPLIAKRCSPCRRHRERRRLSRSHRLPPWLRGDRRHHRRRVHRQRRRRTRHRPHRVPHHHCE